ncbi:MAG: DUF1987 domain-containing protein [Bacteroidales bacterium]|nr:DUF1987 domain-containing protein [Bacteroidales bacterium]MDD3893184.1 DUF1987 domain-containing protein [Bacteroidales bacterium]
MEALIIEGTTTNPEVNFSPDEYTLEIGGYSRPENVHNFYVPLIAWLKDYKNQLKKELKTTQNIEPVTFKFKYIYFNSSSAKFMSDIILLLSDMQKSNIPLKVYWFFDGDDDELREAGEEFSEMANIPFHFVEISR